MARNILSGLGVVLFLTGGLLMGTTMAPIPPTPLAGDTGGYGPLGWIVLTKPFVGIFLIVLGLLIMFRAGRRDDVSEERVLRKRD